MTISSNSTQEFSKLVPDYAHSVLVPVANPATASDLLHLAFALAHPEDGKVIALIVTMGDVEAGAKAADQLKETLEEIKAEGLEIQLEIVNSTSIARGILDTAREMGSDLIILGINNQRERNQTSLGTVVENVLETCDCDVLIYRTGSKSEYDRVILPISYGFQTQIAARIALRLANHRHLEIEAIYSQSSSRPQYEGLAQIEQAIAHVPGKERVKRTVINAQNSAAGILTRVDEHDMIIVGFSQRSEFERVMFGDLARGLLNRAPGPVVMVSRSIGKDSAASRMQRRFLSWLRPTLTRIEQDEIIRTARDMASFNIDFAVLIIIAATLATTGLLLNSAAVIIGAMLVAPLMQPLIALSTGLTVGHVFSARRALGTVVLGVLCVLMVAFVLGWLLPIRTPSAEMLSRGSPTLLDAIVAFASGVIAAYATARKDIPSALAGVAVAAALVPPICTVGIGLAFGENDLAFGAGVLFLTNMISIILAGMIVFIWLGMRPQLQPENRRAQMIALLIFVLFSIPVLAQLVILSRDALLEANIRSQVEEALSPAEVTEFRIIRGNPMTVEVLVRASYDLVLRDYIELENRLSEQVGTAVDLEIVLQRVVRLSVEPEMIEEEDTSESTPEVP